jgi:hypothetical protein
VDDDCPFARDVPTPSLRGLGRIPVSIGRVFSTRVRKPGCSPIDDTSRRPPMRLGDSMPRDGLRCVLKRETP